jgi:hypothetical protein
METSMLLDLSTNPSDRIDSGSGPVINLDCAVPEGGLRGSILVPFLEQSSCADPSQLCKLDLRPVRT